MFNAAHVLETALLILAPFLVGATLGALARIALRGERRIPLELRHAEPAATPAELPEAPALVTAPIIEPLPRRPPGVVPAEIATPDFAAVIQPPPQPEADAPPPRPAGPAMAPARVAGQATSGIIVPAPLRDRPVDASASSGASSAQVIPFPSSQASGDSVDQLPEIQADGDLAVEPLPQPAAPTVVEATEPPPVADLPATPENAAADHDEAAAMRAIEGNWSPGPRQRPAAPVEIAASEAPVAVPVAPAEMPGRLVGLDAPQSGGKDELANIIGVLPIIETSLNSLGVYHFDQVAALTDENVAWLENHLGIEGRIGREHWREQARELAIALASATRSAGRN